MSDIGELWLSCCFMYLPSPVAVMDHIGPATEKAEDLVPPLPPQLMGLLLLLLEVVRLPRVISDPLLRYCSSYSIVFSNSLLLDCSRA